MSERCAAASANYAIIGAGFSGFKPVGDTSHEHEKFAPHGSQLRWAGFACIRVLVYFDCRTVSTSYVLRKHDLVY